MSALADYAIYVDVYTDPDPLLDRGRTVVIPSHRCSPDRAGEPAVKRRVREEAQALGFRLGAFEHVRFVDGRWEARVRATHVPDLFS